MDGLGSADTVEFAGFRFNRRSLVLYRLNGNDLEEIESLNRKALEVLSVLVHHHNDWVNTDNILRAVWPNMVGQLDNLYHQISFLRRVLESGLETGTVIKSIKRRGYRLAVPITALPDSMLDQRNINSPRLLHKNAQGEYHLVDIPHADISILLSVIKARDDLLSKKIYEQQITIDVLHKNIVTRDDVIEAVCKVAIDHGVPVEKLRNASTEIMNKCQSILRDKGGVNQSEIASRIQRSRE
jgi:DNA-binding winged helix-turn-helix (wHTH) protein